VEQSAAYPFQKAIKRIYTEETGGWEIQGAPIGTTTYDPIADHVNLLLQQYFSTQTPDQEPNSVPMITYDDENNSVVMEYMSPDGEQDLAVVQDVEMDQQTEPALLYEKHFGNLQNSELPNQYALEVIPTEDQAREKQEEDEMFVAESHQYQTFEAVPPSGESQWPQVPNFFPQPENPDMLLLPQPVATFERVFEPSSKTDELTKADWFVLDENGRRELDLSFDEEPIAEERSGQVIENDGIAEELVEDNNTERNFIEGDFEPMMAPTQ
jgi:hypothetical protein